MKKNIAKYREVKTFPKNALTVNEYADKMNFSHQYVYKLLKLGKNKFEMITFKGHNFIIPQ
jgi:predicted DNA-binding protein YlxM (UPF0122 family)